MSDIHQDDKPWNQISDAREHRCAPPTRRGKVGRRFDCSCGVTYQLIDTAFGLQWLPTGLSADGARATSRR